MDVPHDKSRLRRIERATDRAIDTLESLNKGAEHEPDRTPRCPMCEYDLSGLDQTGTCPECGRSYTPQGVEKAIHSRDKWKSMYAVRTIAALLAIDVVASIPLSFKRRILGPADFDIVLLVFKVLILDGLIVGVLSILLLRLHKRHRERARIIVRWMFVGGVIGAAVTFVTGLAPDEYLSAPIVSFAFGLGLGAIFGWAASIAERFMRRET